MESYRMKWFVGIMVLICFSMPVFAGSYTYTPTLPQLQDLPHQYYYAWGIEWDGPALGVPGGETIETATLTIENINDWTNEWNDVLHVWLVDELPDIAWSYVNWPGVSRGYDNEGYGDPFLSMTTDGVHLRDYTDTNWWDEDLVIPVPVDTLQDYIMNDEMFGFGFDPDCHYYNDGISLTITTRFNEYDNPVPEPVTGLGVIAGLSGLAGYLRKRKSA